MKTATMAMQSIPVSISFNFHPKLEILFSNPVRKLKKKKSFLFPFDYPTDNR